MNAERVLVAHDSRHGATRGIADENGRTLWADGFTAVVLPADTVSEVRGYDGVVLGGTREHMTFGGAVTAETPGRISRSRGRHGKGGDFRDPERIQDWAHHIGTELGTTR
ncbi:MULTISPECIES: hypothetical protein [unclassified Streptomyces]|uniref:hypothetical protein n=1 Tax=unclassified Streptomyces TaxID=2593676 RepID=UPI0006FB499D|nr:MULTISPECIES: hypothetical protein [unclassified Streptomyces]KQX46250.1 hypothetical protein ASD33_23275 [Streptomyces sp. Root1304]KRA81035.1 hypothetical protein ASE09_16375 [Streptomyces sp. Root66D1]